MEEIDGHASRASVHQMWLTKPVQKWMIEEPAARGSATGKSVRRNGRRFLHSQATKVQEMKATGIASMAIDNRPAMVVVLVPRRLWLTANRGHS
jgi:hypothetical protein